MRRTLAAALTLALVLPAARAEVKWLESEYDFGLMKEIAGPATGRARFVNLGPEEVTVVEARPSCGCTSATYPHDPVAPGDTATVTFTYDPAGRPGRFDKSVKVRFADGSRKSIRIIGSIIGTPESLAQFYPVDAGPIRLSDERVSLGNVTMGRQPSTFVNACNQRYDSIRVSAATKEPALKLKLSETEAGPGDIITLGIYLDTKAWGKPGPFEIPVEITGTEADGKSETHTVTVRGTVIPVRRPVSAKEMEKAPRCVPVPPVVDLGNVSGGVVQAVATLLNEGKSTLHIQNVWCESPKVTIKDYPREIKKGKTGSVAMDVDVDALTPGAFRLDVNVASDDPVDPVTLVRVTGVKE